MLKAESGYLIRRFLHGVKKGVSNIDKYEAGSTRRIGF